MTDPAKMLRFSPRKTEGPVEDFAELLARNSVAAVYGCVVPSDDDAMFTVETGCRRGAAPLHLCLIAEQILRRADAMLDAPGNTHADEELATRIRTALRALDHEVAIGG